MSGRIYSGSLVALSLLIALAVSWPAFLIVAAVWLLVLVAWAMSSRSEARKRADAAEAQAEKFADECAACHAANEVLTVELACADGTIHHLQNDLIAAHKRLSDYENGAEVIAFPSQREASPYDWPVADGYFPVHTEATDADIEALMRATEEN